MAHTFSALVTRTALRTGIALFVGLTLTGVALAQPNNNGGGGGKNQQHCEDVATADYQFNMQSCRDSLPDNPQQEGLCEEDASYEYLDQLAACKNVADITGAFGTGLNGSGGLTLDPGNGNNGGKGGRGKGLGQSIVPKGGLRVLAD